METPNTFKSFDALARIAAETGRIDIPTGTAYSLALPIKTGPQMLAVYFLYRAPFKINKPQPGKAITTIYPPHRVVYQDAVSGQVVRVHECSPNDFGIDHPVGKPISENVIDFRPGSGEQFFEQKDRFNAISPAVWAEYNSQKGTPDQRVQALVREYRDLFYTVAKPVLVPYYHAITPDFFRWLESASK
jgi:hypothetical protein